MLPDPVTVLPKTQIAAGQPDAISLVLQRIRLRARRRLAWLGQIRSEKTALSQGDLPIDSVSAVLENLDSPTLEEQWYSIEPGLQEINQRLSEVEIFLEGETSSRLAELRRLFGLDRLEMDLLQLCLALDLDPALERVYAALQENQARNYVTENLAARLFGYGRCLLWSQESALRCWELVNVREMAAGEPPLLAGDRQIRDWLLGQNSLDETLVGLASIQPPLSPLQNWPVTETMQQLQEIMGEPLNGRARIRVVGRPGSGRHTLAANISTRLGLPLLTIHSDEVADGTWAQVYRRAQRQAYLDRCALAWDGATAAQRPWLTDIPPFPLQFVICESDQSMPVAGELVDFLVVVPEITLAERRQMWLDYQPAASDWPEEGVDRLAARYQLNPGEIAAIARRGVMDAQKAAQLARQTQRGQLGGLAQALECPFSWDDLVVKDTLRQTLEDLVYEAGARAAFWENPAARRLFPQGKGLVGLFSGPSGTGKTMAAQVVAASLGLDLFRIDLSAVVSKYVGETSQNLERILARAEHMDIVLLFDEADALFGKRTEVKDAHDRYANTDTNYLLQAIESYRGVALLATNKKGNLDEAYLRRIRYVLEFERPDAAQRRKIWQQVLVELAGADRLLVLAGGLDRLAEALDITGAQIKYALLAAVFTANRAGQPLGMVHVLRGLERELIKEGRTLNERERAALLRGG